MIRSRLSGRYIKPPVQVPQKIIIFLVLAGLCHLGGLMIGWNLQDFLNPPVKSPVPEGYIFEVQTVEAEEAVNLTPEVTQAPTSTPTPTAMPAPSVDSNEVVEYIKSKPWPAHEALAVAKCESGYYPLAVGDQHLDPHSYGIFQIRAFPGRPQISELLDFKQNIDYAFQMWSTQGWGPWSCKRVLN